MLDCVQAAADHALDALTVPLHDWANLSSSCHVPRWFNHAIRLGHGGVFGRRLLQHLVAVLCKATTLALAFVQVRLL